MTDATNVVATMRSGHHAFIAWFRRHAPAEWAFRDNRRLHRIVARDLPRAEADPSTIGVIFNFEGVTGAGYDRARAARAPWASPYARSPS